ncbi:InlB B-repeat-containing protein [Lysinibacillus pakistanensis]|uniref:Leucine-rich repeat protein n=1 Tax=Lysinibacillus pakistanensis TaxID=759811 RepID=A0ABX6D809_9BACI|nr:leucine-rich repeat protein [Lysinibacillus pakistanensis]
MKTKSIKYGILFTLFFIMMIIKIPFTYANEGEYDFDDNPDGSVTIKAYTGTDGTVVIPDQLSGKVVTGIDSWVFNNKKLTSITIPETITTIGAYAFYQNQLTSVTLPGSITSISDGAFSLNQLTNVTLPNNLINIGSYAFSGNLLEHIDIPNGVINIGNHAFSNNDIVSVKIPNGMEIIGESAFAGNDIESIDIPESMKIIGAEAFSNNYLKAIRIHSKDIEIGDDVFIGHHPDMIIYAPNSSTAKEYAEKSNIKFQVLKYTVLFETNGGTSIDSQDIELNKKVNQPNNSIKLGYAFEGWYKDTSFIELWQFHSDFVTADTTLYAKWTSKPDVEVLFESNDGSVVAPEHMRYNDKLPEPSNPTKANFIFEGWYKDADLTEKWNFATDRVQANIILYAKWAINEHTLSFVSNGGTAVPPQTIAYNEKAIKPQNPIRIGYVFEGWYKDSDHTEKWDFAMDRVQANIILYAKWAIKEHTLSFVSNDGTAVSPQTIAYNEKAIKPQNPIRIGYVFEGWYKDQTFTTQWHFDTNVVTEDTKLYAKWRADSSTGGGGYSPNPTPNPTPIPKELTPVPEYPKPTPEQPKPEKPDSVPVEPVEPQPPKPTPQPEEDITFSDVPKDHWAWTMIQTMAKQGVITGYPDGTFKPNAPVQRQHVALMLARAMELEPKKEALAFNDISATHPYAEVIQRVQQAGLFDGVNGNFNPTDNMTRAQMAKVLVLAFHLTSMEKEAFHDVPATHWAYDYIAILAANGIALGDNGNFKPEDYITRAQFAAFLHRALQQ